MSVATKGRCYKPFFSLSFAHRLNKLGCLSRFFWRGVIFPSKAGAWIVRPLSGVLNTRLGFLPNPKILNSAKNGSRGQVDYLAAAKCQWRIKKSFIRLALKDQRREKNVFFCGTKTLKIHQLQFLVVSKHWFTKAGKRNRQKKRRKLTQQCFASYTWLFKCPREGREGKEGEIEKGELGKGK